MSEPEAEYRGLAFDESLRTAMTLLPVELPYRDRLNFAAVMAWSGVLGYNPAGIARCMLRERHWVIRILQEIQELLGDDAEILCPDLLV